MATDPPSNTDKLSVSSVVAVDQTSDTLKEVMYPTHTQHWQQMSKESKLGSDEEQYPQYMEDDVEELDPMAVKKLRRKLDFHLVPLVSILYLCSFLDRVNIGNAKVAGLSGDLNLTASEYNWALSIFFIGYVLFEVPSNLCLKLVGPKIWISSIMVVWGGIMMSMAAVKTPASLLVARFFLGVAECGLFPGIVYYFSLWYTRNELAFRNGLFFSTATMAGAFGGLLAWQITRMDGIAGLHGWQWIFILEGLPTILLTLVVYVFLPDLPETASFLNATEKQLAIRRLEIDAGPANQRKFSWKEARMAFMDWKVYLHMGMYIFSTIPLYSLAFFMPSVVMEFQLDPVTTQVMTVPAYLVACICTVGNAFSSDHFQERGFHFVVPNFIACLGYVLLIVTREQSIAVRYVCLTITTSGIFALVPAMVSWFTSNIGGHTKRNVATGAIISVGNIGGAIGGHIYHLSDAANGYAQGHTLNACFLVVSGVLVLVMKYLLTKENQRRVNLTPEEFEAEAQGENLCDLHPGFRYWT